MQNIALMLKNYVRSHLLNKYYSEFNFTLEKKKQTKILFY